MATPVFGNSSTAPGLLASPVHTAIVVVLNAFNAYRGTIFAARVRAGFIPNRPLLYLRTIFIELLILGVVLVGLRMRGTSLRAALGKRWQSMGEFVRDTGIGAAVWCVSIFAVALLSGHSSAPDESIRFLLPQTKFEFALWLVVALTAGVCEEAVFRGYYLQQFKALTRSVWAGILISSLLFGAAHSYQGFRRAFVIGIWAIAFGFVAEWRGSVRPGMIAHAFQDAIAPVLVRLIGR